MLPYALHYTTHLGLTFPIYIAKLSSGAGIYIVKSEDTVN